MESIAMMNSVLPPMQKKHSTEESLPISDNTYQEKSSVTASDKQLQPDQVEISDASRQKLSASQEKEKEQQSDIFENVETQDELGETSEASETEESDLDKKIRELSVEILELTIKIEMLKNKEDVESMQEAQELEVELAIKKGTLDAMVTQKLEMASRGL